MSILKPQIAALASVTTRKRKRKSKTAPKTSAQSANMRKHKRKNAIKSQQTLAALLKNPEAERIEYGGSIGYFNYFYFSIDKKQKYFHTDEFPSRKDAENAANECLNKSIKDNNIKNNKHSVREEDYYICTVNKKSKRFNVKDYPNRETAFEAANEHQKKRSAELNLDRKIPAISISTELKQYIAGFLDGDGCITLRYHKGYDVRVTFGQSEEKGIPEILNIIKNIYGGSITRQTRKVNNRQAWILEIHQENTYVMLTHLAQYCVLKAKQAEVALQCRKDLLAGDHSKCDEYIQTVKRMKDEYQATEFDTKRITQHWLCGFFDAEGTVGVWAQSLKVSFAQKSCVILLHEIDEYYRKKYNFRGRLRIKGEICYGSDNAYKVVCDLLESGVCVVKKEQLLLAKRFWELKLGKKKSTRAERFQIEEQIRKLKDK